MNRKIFLSLCIFGLGALIILNGCGILNSGGSSTLGTFYTQTSSTTPVFKPASVSTSSINPLADAWSSGTPLYSVYYSLREFISSRDEGVVDRSNLYKLLIDVDTVFSGLSSSAVSITEQEITAPFDKLQKVICDKAYNDTSGRRAIAMKETTGEINAIITWIWTDSTPNKEEYGIAAIKYDKITNNITVDMTFSVDYDISTTTTDYNLRCYVYGNASTDTFEYKYIVGDNKIVAKGVSRGAGNYMLFKYVGGSSTTEKFIVAEGTADESFFSAQNSTPTAIYTSEAELPATVAAYKDWVVSTEAFTAADLVTDISVLNTGNPKRGTIYIDYN